MIPSKHVAYWQVALEDLIDAGLGTPEEIAWDNAHRARIIALWAALPWWWRAWRVARSRWREIQRRTGHAYDALRGVECDE